MQIEKSLIINDKEVCHQETTFNSYEESPKSYNSYFITTICIYISFLTEQWEACTKLTQQFLFISLLDMICAHSTNNIFLPCTDK